MEIMRYCDVFMKKKTKSPRHLKSWSCANSILAFDKFHEFRIWCYQHPKIKSLYRAGNLFLLNSGLRYREWPEDYEPVSVNMDTLLDYWFDDVQKVNLYA